MTIRRGRPVGRRVKLTEARQQKIVQAIALGTPLVTAFQYAGISHETGYEWLRKGEHPAKAPIYAAFLEAVTQARAQDEMRRIGRIEQAGRGGAVIARKTIHRKDGTVETEERTAPPDWQADAWFLERSRSQTWGRQDRLDLRVTQIEQAADKVAEETGMTRAEVLAEAELLLQELDDAKHA